MLMKYNFLYFFLNCALLLLLSSKVSAKEKKLKGIIIYEKDTVEVAFLIPITIPDKKPYFGGLQYEVSYEDTAGYERRLKAKDALEIQFVYLEETIRMLSRKFNSEKESEEPIFLKLLEDGPVKLFQYFPVGILPANEYGRGAAAEVNHSPLFPTTVSSALTTNSTAYQKYDEPLKRPKEVFFKKDMIEYFSDCPALVKQIHEKKLWKFDLLEIAVFYNEQCH